MHAFLLMADLMDTAAGAGLSLVVVGAGAAIKMIVGTDKKSAVDASTITTRLEAHEKRSTERLELHEKQDVERYARIESGIARIENSNATLANTVTALATKLDERTVAGGRDPTGPHKTQR